MDKVDDLGGVLVVVSLVLVGDFEEVALAGGLGWVLMSLSLVLLGMVEVLKAAMVDRDSAKEMLLVNGWMLMGKVLLVLVKVAGRSFLIPKVRVDKLISVDWDRSGEKFSKLRGVFMSQGNFEKFGWGPEKS